MTSNGSYWCSTGRRASGRPCATNLIESVMARLEAKTRRVTHWRTSDQKLRWCASVLWAAERQFRRIKNHGHLPLLKAALQRTLSSTNIAAA